MAINEHSIGPFYFANVKLGREKTLPTKVGIVEMTPPWRRGSAVLLWVWPYRAIALGLWSRTIDEDIEEDFSDDQWFEPKWLDTTPDTIRTWAHAEAEEAREVRRSGPPRPLP